MLMLCAVALAGTAAAVTTPELEVVSSHGCGDEAVFVSGEYLDFTIRLLNTLEQSSVTVQVHITMGNGQKSTLGATLSNTKPEVTFSGMRQTFPVPPGPGVGVISVDAVLPGGNTTPVTCIFTTVDATDATPLPTITVLPSATPTATASALATTVTPVPTASPTPPACAGDCDGSGQVSVDELLAMVNIALGNAEVSTCMMGDENQDQQVSIDELLTAVNNALNDCPTGVLDAHGARPGGGP